MTRPEAGCSLKTAEFSAQDIERFAEIHEAEIQNGFLTSLGRGALRLLYSEVAESHHCMVIAGLQGEDAEPVGFIVGTLDCAALYRDFLKHRGLSALRVFLPRLFSWSRLIKGIETLSYPAKDRRRASASAEIIGFAVQSAYQGTGLAEALFRELMRRFGAKGVKEVRIVTGGAQVRAHRFYDKMGARRIGTTSVHKGQTDLVFLFELN